VLGTGWTEAVALVAAFAIAVITTPAGVSGAVLLLPFQVRVLGTSGPSVTPTNLLYNVVACPGALWRYRRQGQTGGTLTRLLLIGTVPGVIAGSVIRVYVLPGPEVFELVIGVVLLPLGAVLALTQVKPDRPGREPRLPPVVVALIAAAAGCIGGIYGVGGGSILAPVLIGDGRPAAEVAPASLMSTFVTSVAGVATFSLLAVRHQSVAPDWVTGITLGVGGLAGGYVGARIQHRLPESVIRRALGGIVVVVGALFMADGLT
jgi:uncharacterized protein